MRCASLVVLSALAACSAPDPESASCPAAVEQPLFNAAAVESYLGLSPAETRAVVRVTNDTGPNAPVCSGAFVAKDWVVTAAHCLVIEAPEVVVSGDDLEPPAAFQVLEERAHPSVDVALLRVDVPDTGFGGAPLGLLAPGKRPIAIDDVVEIAGYGLTETNGLGELRFLAESVVAVEDQSVLVNGFGKSGACQGDSGGPLLVRNASGQPVVAGVLTSGDGSCRGRDRYVQLDAVRPWFDRAVPEGGAPQVPCGGISDEGRCLYGSAISCSDGSLVAKACAEGTRCGWDRDADGFRCVVPALDPCAGVDSVGSCQEDLALRCDHGELVRTRCACGKVCRIDGKTGAPHCADPSN